MLTRVGNLLVALFTSLCVFLAVPGRYQWDYISFAVWVVALVWVAGAIGLFYHKRTAWICSMIGACALLSFAMLLCFLAVSEIIRDGRSVLSDTKNPLIFGIFAFGLLTLEISIPAWLVVGLLKLRKSDVRYDRGTHA